MKTVSPPLPSSEAVSLDQLVQQRLYPQLEHFFDLLSREGADVRIDGVAALRSDDKFLPGKVALGLGHVLLNLGGDDPRRAAYLARYRDIAELTVEHDNHTWGIYYYLLMLVRLREAGLLDEAIRPATLARLREKLDWRSFVDAESLQLIELPTNYYGVAFSVARLRQMLGWDGEAPVARLLQQMLEHYERYSGAFGFSDETAGDGRFDRYSVLLVAEVCQRFVQTGLAVPPRLLELLRKSALLVLSMAHPDGHGFSYGRSIGPYGDSAVVEILSVAAHLGVLDTEQQRHAYSYSMACLEKYLSFWFDPTIHSVDMWGQGRRTDGYRAKHRILGENFSLIHQYLSSNVLWNAAGFRGQRPDRGALRDWLQRTQPPLALTWFARGTYERALAVRRDGDDVFCLPLVNGGHGQHANSPYHAIPFAEGLVAGIADSGGEHPQLLPRFLLDDGSVLLPTSFITDIRSGSSGASHWLSFRQPALNRLGAADPRPDPRLRVETRYEFEPGRITRVDRVLPGAPLRIAELSLDFLSFSRGARIDGTTARFAEGRVRSFDVQGLPLQHVLPTTPDDPFKSPSGPMRSWLRYAAKGLQLSEPLTLRWSFEYR